MLTEKQLKLIELLVNGDMMQKDALASLGIPPTTFQYWRTSMKRFQDAYDEAIEIKVNEAKKNIRRNVNVYIDRLDRLSEDGANENAKVNAISKLLTLAELDPQFKSEISIKKDDSDSKNYLLELLEQKKKDKQED